VTRLGSARRRALGRYAGLTLLLAGVLLVAGGLWRPLTGALAAAGTPSARIVAGTVSALLVPGALLVALSRVAAEQVLRAGAGGAALAVVGVALAVPAATRPLGVAGYALGVLALVSTLVAATRLPDAPGVAWRAAESETDASQRRAPADGGEAEDDLDFPLDEE